MKAVIITAVGEKFAFLGRKLFIFFVASICEPYPDKFPCLVCKHALPKWIKFFDWMIKNICMDKQYLNHVFALVCAKINECQNKFLHYVPACMSAWAQVCTKIIKSWQAFAPKQAGIARFALLCLYKNHGAQRRDGKPALACIVFCF
ncbi:hypothetical protein DFR42_1042 [Undibacterium pigrum]|uniref:Uncharacterized protein n=1 Tax=Undibacterium pigrum TaxID=401470 RepID=A0A318JRM5_9BURK|nr:hypothetical protein DFR42_1042 [Undibacterium pigrum]